jgi:hypothetical protein
VGALGAVTSQETRGKLIAATTTEHGTQGRTTSVRPGIRSLVGLTLVVTTVATAGVAATMPAGATTPTLAQQVLAIAGTHGPSDLGASRIAQAPDISKVTTASGSGMSTTPTVSSTTTDISATYTGTTLVVSWATGNTLTVTGSRPLTAGSTISNLNLGTGQTAAGTIVVGGSLACSAPTGIGVVSIDQLVTAGSGTVTTLALQFGCVTSLVGVAITGTVGLNVPASTRTPGYNLYEGNGTVSSPVMLGSSNINDTSIFGVDTFGDLSSATLNQPVVGMATTALDGGYWLVAGDGGVFSFGDARFYGSTGNLHLNKPVVGMAATPDGKGYWFVASDGGVFSYGDARFYGSTGALHLNRPIVGMATTPDGKGYWLVASDGGVFSFGDASFHGSTGAIRLNQPIVGMAPTPSGNGYWLVAADGGIFTFGDAGFHGSAGSIKLNSPIVGMAATPSGDGYWLAASDGGVFSFGAAPFGGSLGGNGVNDVAGIAR